MKDMHRQTTQITDSYNTSALRPETRPSMRRLLAESILAGLGSAALTFLYLRPLLRRFATHIAPDPGDPLFVLYLLEWGVHQLELGFPAFWDAPFFYPHQGVVGLSEHLLGPVVAAAALGLVLPGPAAVYNALLVSSFALCGASAWFVLRASGIGVWGALIGALTFAFSPFRWDHMSHLQILLAGLIPLVLWSFDRLLVTPTWRRAGLFLALYLAHLSGGLYFAYMIHIPLAVLLANRARELRAGLRQPAARRVLLAATILAAAAAVAIFGPYLAADQAFDIMRSRSEARAYGATVLSYLTPSWWGAYSWLWPDRLRRPENSLFAGVLPTLLAAAGLVLLWRRGRRPVSPLSTLSRSRRLTLGGLAATALAGLLLSDLHTWSLRYPDLERWSPGHSYLLSGVLLLGGTVGWLLLRRRWSGWPLCLADPWMRGLLVAGAVCLALTLPPVFRAAREILPGLAGMRVPPRFYPFVSLPLALLAGLASDRLLASVPGRRRALAGLAVTALLCLDLAPRQMAWIAVPPASELPPVYAWIAAEPGVRALLELPWEAEGTLPFQLEIEAMVRGTSHWKPLVNGYSGHLPPFHTRLHQVCCWPLPEGQALTLLRGAGVTHVLVHVDQLPKRWQRRRARAWDTTGEVETVYDDGRDRVFRILPERSGRSRASARRPGPTGRQQATQGDRQGDHPR
jgi:hypothetical protein